MARLTVNHYDNPNNLKYLILVIYNYFNIRVEYVISYISMVINY